MVPGTSSLLYLNVWEIATSSPRFKYRLYIDSSQMCIFGLDFSHKLKTYIQLLINISTWMLTGISNLAYPKPTPNLYKSPLPPTKTKLKNNQQQQNRWSSLELIHPSRYQAKNNWCFPWCLSFTFHIQSTGKAHWHYLHNWLVLIISATTNMIQTEMIISS